MYINYRTGKDFFLDNNEYILSDELKNQFLYTNAKSSWDILSNPNNFYIKVFNNDREIFMIKNSPHPMVIIGAESLIPEAISSLDKLQYSFSGILGSRSITDTFIIEWTKINGGRFVLNNDMDIMFFLGVGEFNEKVHLCNKEDVMQIANLIIGFYKDIWNYEISLEEAIKKANEKKNHIYGYFIENKCVSMAALSRETEQYQSINFAYTTPEYRGKGYMQAIMKHCAKVIANKGKIAQLHVDRSNVISNHVYKKVGFKVYCNNVHYDYHK